MWISPTFIIVKIHLSWYQVIKPFSKSYLGLPHLSFELRFYDKNIRVFHTTFLWHPWISSSYSYRIEILGRSLQDANNRFNVMNRSNTHGYQNISAHTHEIPKQ